jgi:ArsR family transcriptional regulator
LAENNYLLPMDLHSTSDCLEALGNPTRLAMFRLLVEAGDDGAPVGVVQSAMGIPASTLSHHLARLMRVGLVSQERRSRSLICRVDYDVINGVTAYLLKNCCAGIDSEEAVP